MKFSAWLDLLEQRHPRVIDLGLARCGQVYRRMGSPRPAPQIFTVAGTNGKGSTVAYLSTVLQACGYSCARYTSPHLLHFTERLCLNGQALSEAEWVEAFKATEKARGSVSLTYFEFTTLAAFWLMARSGVQSAVLEVGLGGRLDTVNLVDADCAVITPIGMDHQAYLGTDREAIGFEKAGILRAGRPAICGDRQAPVSLRTKAKHLACDWQQIGQHYDWHDSGNGIRLQVGEKSYPLPALQMPGSHQVDNLSTALAAFEQLNPGQLQDADRWLERIAKLAVAGRLMPWAGDQRVLLDVGHNPMAAQAVAHTLKAGTGALHVVVAMLADKDAESVAQAFSGQVALWYCAGLGGARGQSGAQLARRIASVDGLDNINESNNDGVNEGTNEGLQRISVFETVGHALSAALAGAEAEDQILVFGSFETVAAVLRESTVK